LIRSARSTPAAAFRAAVALALCATTLRVRAEWLDYAVVPGRNAVAVVAPINVDTLLWLGATDAGNQTIKYEGSTCPAVFGGRIFANARLMSGATHVSNRLVAFDVISGQFLHQTTIDKSLLESWASPVVDSAQGRVLVCSGSKLFAVNAASGGVAWNTPCAHPLVNVAPAIARDVSPGRVFVADFDPFGGDGRLYCINTSPFNAGSNPYNSGDILWEEVLGETTGPTPAYDNGIVYAATRSGSMGLGTIYAFDVDAPAGLRQLWATAVGSECYGGLCVTGGNVYAATYGFFGSGDNSLLVKLRASDGALLWSIGCERTASIPIVDGNRLYLSAGLNGFGSTPKVQCFRDDGASAVKLWDTAADTGGSLSVGGWTLQPVLSNGILYAGRIPAGASTSLPYTDLLLLDLARSPGDAGFVRQSRAGAGSSPALSGGRLYSLGPAGLNALAACGDFSGDGRLNGDDIQGFLAAQHAAVPTTTQKALADLNANGAIDADDRARFVNKLLGL